LYSHQAVYTVDEASKFYAGIPGLHCKNLFLKDSKRKTYYLISLPFDKKIPLKEMRKVVGAKKLTFASPEELQLILGLEPGSVTPFGLVNAPPDAKIEFALDSEIAKADFVCFHPNVNTETLSIPKESFQKILKCFSNIEIKYI